MSKEMQEVGGPAGQPAVLIVDDEEAIREVFSVLLARHGYRVLAAGGASEALRLFDREHPDIVLTDLLMPGIDGFGLIAALKEKSPDTPIVVVSGTGRIQDAIDAMREGAWDYATKPVREAAELDLIIRRTLERARLVAENRRHQERLEDLVAEQTRELRESEDRFRVLIEQAPVAIVLAKEGRIHYANPSFLRMVRLDNADQALGRSVVEFTAPDRRDASLDRARRRELGLDVEREYETLALRADGSPCPVLVAAAHISRADGPVTAFFLTDLTERKRAEEAVTRLVAAVEQAADDIVITDAEGTIRYVNPAFVQTTGYATDEVLGRNPRIFKSGKHGEDFYRALWKTLKQGCPWKGRFLNRTKEGRNIFQDASIAPIRDASGRTMGYVAARRDVTAHVQMERQLAQAERLEAIGTLAGGIAHDFNNVLSAVVGYTELARMRLEPGSKAHEDLSLALQACGRAADLVRQILTFARQTPQEARPISTRHLVKEALGFLRAAIPASIDIRHHIASDAFVVADPSEIQRIVVNLCTNAALAMGDEGGVIEVGLEDATADEALSARLPGLAPGKSQRLSVRDTGCGMPAEVLEHLFEPFFTTRAEGKGTGMGLSVVHGIVSARGGAIEVQSEPGKGTAFQVYFPAVAPTGAAQTETEREPLPGTESILFVDDEAMVADLAHRLLGRLGYRVRVFTRSTEALAAFEAEPRAFDVVITDLIMPGMNGDELARRLREVRADIPVILCTGYCEMMTPEGAAARGFDELAMKPLRSAELSGKIREVLACRSGPRPLTQ